jgi:hypothetical protein
MPKKPIIKKETKPYNQDGNLEAHIIADMLRIESITTELREFKDDTKMRFNKLESWIVAIVGITVTSLLAIIGIFIESLLG